MDKSNFVYITKASLKLISKKIIKKIQSPSRYEIIKDLSDDFEGVVASEDLNDIFNNQEIEELYTLKMILKDFELLLKEVDQNKQAIYENIRSNNTHYLFNVKAPAYHTQASCEWMFQSFQNIKLPSAFQAAEKKVMVEQWITQHKALAFDALNQKFQTEFHTTSNLEQVEYANSGAINLENIQIKQHLKLRLKKGFTQLRFFFDQEFAHKIINYKYAPKYKIHSTSFNDQKEYQAVIDFHTIKGEVYDLILEHFQAQYNQKLAFQSFFLDALGFRKCKICAQEFLHARSA